MLVLLPLAHWSARDDGPVVLSAPFCWNARKGDDTVGNPHRAQIYQFELFELILLLKLNKQLPVEQSEATASHSTVPSTPSDMQSRTCTRRARARVKKCGKALIAETNVLILKGNHLSNTTCPTQVFFKSGE